VHALVGDEFVTIRLPYPLGFYAKGFEGRIDDANAGWKGRGLWVSNNTDGLVHTERKRGFISHVQFRDNPLSR